jgi:hypothetical protein
MTLMACGLTLVVAGVLAATRTPPRPTQGKMPAPTFSQEPQTKPGPLLDQDGNVVATPENIVRLNGEVSVLRDRILALELRDGELEGRIKDLEREPYYGTPRRSETMTCQVVSAQKQWWVCMAPVVKNGYGY